MLVAMLMQTLITNDYYCGIRNASTKTSTVEMIIMIIQHWK